MKHYKVTITDDHGVGPAYVLKNRDEDGTPYAFVKAEKTSHVMQLEELTADGLRRIGYRVEKDKPKKPAKAAKEK